MNCLKCGSSIPEQSRFCNFCGAQVEAAQQAAAQPQLPSGPQIPAQQTPCEPQLRQSVYQQPTYAQQVYQDRQTAMAYAASSEGAPRAKAPRKKLPLPAVIAAGAVLAVILLALVLGFVFGKKTVYLLSERVVEDTDTRTSYVYRYTDNGMLAFCQVDTEYIGRMEGLAAVSTGASYSYDRKGRPESVEFRVDGESYEYEYVYDRDGRLEELEGDGNSYEIKCDDKGRITAVESEDSDYFRAKYTYHDNGVLKKAAVVCDGTETVYRFDERGNMLSTTVSRNGSKISVVEYSYDKKNRVTESVTESYYWGERSQTITIAYSYGNGLLTAYEIRGKMDTAGFTLLFETDEEGLERSLELTDFETTDLLSEIDLGKLLEDVSVDVVYDDRGNLLEMELGCGALQVISSRQTNSYVEVRVPRNHVMIYQDPIYFGFIDPEWGARPAAEAPVADAPVADAPATEPPIDYMD